MAPIPNLHLVAQLEHLIYKSCTSTHHILSSFYKHGIHTHGFNFNGGKDSTLLLALLSQVLKYIFFYPPVHQPYSSIYWSDTLYQTRSYTDEWYTTPMPQTNLDSNCQMSFAFVDYISSKITLLSKSYDSPFLSQIQQKLNINLNDFTPGDGIISKNKTKIHLSDQDSEQNESENTRFRTIIQLFNFAKKTQNLKSLQILQSWLFQTGLVDALPHFVHNFNISDLDLRDNGLETLPKCIFSMKKLIRLDISNNPLKLIENLQLIGSQLKVLKVNNCHLYSLDCTHCPQLIQLECCDNFLSHLDLSCNPQLKFLYASRNEISVMNHFPPSLERCFLDYNNFKFKDLVQFFSRFLLSDSMNSAPIGDSSQLEEEEEEEKVKKKNSLQNLPLCYSSQSNLPPKNQKIFLSFAFSINDKTQTELLKYVSPQCFSYCDLRQSPQDSSIILFQLPHQPIVNYYHNQILRYLKYALMFHPSTSSLIASKHEWPFAISLLQSGVIDSCPPPAHIKIPYYSLSQVNSFSFAKLASQFKLCIFKDLNEFPQVVEFLLKLYKKYDIQNILSVSTTLQDLQIKMIKNNKVFLLSGVRRSDPGHSTLPTICPSTPDWPKCWRVMPILDFTYSQVWLYLILTQFDYCKLYDQGYTSLGTRQTTFKHPLLLPKGFPAYALTFSDKCDGLERDGRIISNNSKLASHPE